MIVENLLHELAAHGEVRVGKIIGLLTENLRDPIGPAPVPSRKTRFWIADALRE